LGADLSQLEGKTLNQWLAAPTTADLWDNASVVFGGEASEVSQGVYRIFSSAGTNSFVNIASVLTIGRAYLVKFNVDSITTLGAGVRIQDSGEIFTTTGAKTSLLIATANNAFIKRGGTVATDIQISGVEFYEIPGNHLRAGTWASPSDAARASYVIQTDPALYDVSGQPELVTNGDNTAALMSTSPAATLTRTTAAQSTDLGGFVAKITGDGTTGPHYFIPFGGLGMEANKSYVITFDVYIPTAWVGAGIKAIDISDGSFSTPNVTARDEWVTVSAVRGAKASAWTLGIGQNASETHSGQFFYIDNLSIKEIPAAQYKYALSFGGVDDYYSLLNAISITESMTVVRAFKRASAGINSRGFGAAAAFEPRDATYNATDQIQIALGGSNKVALPGRTESGSLVVTSVRNATEEYIRVNGVEVYRGAAPAVTGAFDVFGRTGPIYHAGEQSFASVNTTELTGADLALVEQIAAATNGATLA
jgi:hypothetical protein